MSRPKGEEEMREAILAATRDLLRRYGLRKLTMEDIAAALGKRKSFLYYYYPGKSDVLAALVEREFEDISKAIRAAVDLETDPAARFRTYFFVRSEQIVARLANHDIGRKGLVGAEDIAEILQLTEQRRRFDESEIRYVADLIAHGVRRKVFRPLSEKDILLFCQFSFAALRGTELELILHPKSAHGLKARMDITFEVLMNGLLR